MNSRLVRLNVVSGVIGQFITIILNFLIRSIFIRYLGSENVGLNGLYSNVLGVLSVAELGIGSAIVAHMYKPIADGDSKRIKLLMNIYRKVYKTIAWFLLVMGFILLPFISEVTKTYNGYYNVHVIFLMYVLNSFISFYIGYKQSIVIANGKSYVINKVTMMLFLPIALCQIISLVVCQSFYLYMTLILINTLSLHVIFLMYVLNSFISFYIGYKQSIVIANGKSYVINKVTMMLFLPIALCQIISLVVCQSFYLYMTLILINTLSLNIIIARYAKKHFRNSILKRKKLPNQT
ncbi:oligosaccharide flippase family protein [Weissella cibaria]|nr:oligosaccharide flippase family protein [Weissella cibaria]